MTSAGPLLLPADHRPYIETVRVALLLDDIRAASATFGNSRVRTAAMTLFLANDDSDEDWHYTFTSAERVELRWSEEEGWSLLALHAADDGGRLPTIWRYGFGAVLPPEEIRAWLAVLLTMPGFSPSQEVGPHRSHQHADAAFEASLASYAL